ncbi:MAG: hypothetical protein KGL75_09415, partial [Acidobacteriota bacterium]|nr:hypothetical protein [Acidobacteriota bacterium]
MRSENAVTFGTRSSLRSKRALCVYVLLSVGFAVISAKAQQPSAPPSELSQNNLSLVAASASEIKAVLLVNTGLLIELKQWVAKDASEHGQIISESDLTDNAIYDRLDSDVKFRSVATRLLQRYGYLLPQVNPDSPMGKEQELLIQERVRWVAQDEDQQRAAAHQRAMAEVEERAEGCGPDVGLSCNNPSQQRLPIQSAPQQNRTITPLVSPPWRSPQDEQTFPNSPNVSPGTTNSLEQALLLRGGGGLGNQSSLGGLNSDSAGVSGSLLGEGTQGLASNSSGSLLNSSSGGGGLFSEDADASNPFGALTPQPSSGSGTQFASLLGAMNSGSGTSLEEMELNAGVLPGVEGGSVGLNSAYGGAGSGLGGSIGQARVQQFRTRPVPQPVELMRASNPYANVPSLYDMYLQAVPRPQTPTRFG